MAVNKVIYGNNTLIDITDTTATPEQVLSNYYFYGANGIKVSGQLLDGDSLGYGDPSSCLIGVGKIDSMKLSDDDRISNIAGVGAVGYTKI